ncbi:NitT/TauT family transport system ATP-binding protein [Ochrobactrum sp. J50]|jgi:NitT/TauT family transport system ATP-binding protein|uniref:ABC transporter ATP-binding protein n=1 Tax=Brucella pseudintermedia TaxID=370111 RepID=A0ABY5UGG4_9HYPH|nr:MULTISPECIES: ABC transporter ATP-binding protein [Brucella/Ochrobactrum group]MCO7727519.1 ABC transporter ATP-binding protein [Brucella intermedia]NKE74953.1 ABC transporter ATP-binding protein [Ochrobactrum sp. MC-1LL]TWH03238.1 NitT/TauT family transport system ATP-binding protein [Ochrobactrum sp. J50]UWL62439.1 ABC transporter ATP-binding protein [Brucella pseudintermedia]WPM81575.1 ABC transporter ATP-binding protein [Brucella pseudintermedia]
MSAEPSLIQAEETRKTAIALKDVQISFKLADGGRFDAVAESNLEVAENEFVAIVGPTGCGKSTLLNAVAGLLVPASGTVEISGQRLQGLNRKAGYLFQQDALMPWKTVLDNVAIGLEIAGTPKAQAREQAREWLGRVGLASFGDRYPHMLSGGQRKRVGLAQVLIRNPKYLLMDEPFGPLDAQTRVIMGDLLLDLWSQDKKAVMFVTHDLEEAIALADRVVIMSAGPRARIMAEYKIPLVRPREISEIRLDDKFHEIHREIWSALKEEVLKGYQQTSGEKK